MRATWRNTAHVKSRHALGETQGYPSPRRDFKPSKARRGGDTRCSFWAAEEPGLGARHCFPPLLPGSPTRHRRCKAMHLTMTVSSKGAFLLTALLERNRATPARFWGSKPLFVSAFAADWRTHACPPLQSNHGPSQQPGFCLVSHSGGSFHALGTPSSQKHTFRCAFWLLCIILRFEIHLVRNMQRYQPVIIAA